MREPPGSERLIPCQLTQHRLAANPRTGDHLADSEDILPEAATTLDFKIVAARWEQLADADGAHAEHERAHEYRNARCDSDGASFRFETAHGVVEGTAMRVALPPGSSPIEPSSEAEVRVFVLDATDELALVDSQTGLSERPNGGPVFATFALAGSPDDDAEGERVSFGITDATGLPIDDVTSAGAEIAIDGRTFRWLAEGENQRIYVGPSSEGATLAMATLNVDEATAVDLLRGAEATVAGGASFGDRVVPDGWVDTGTSTTLLQFVAGATGSSTSIDGTRDLYGDPENAATPSWDDINSGFGVTLSTWPVSGTDPEAEARYNLDGELPIEIQRADGSTTTGFASPDDGELTEYVVWQDGTFWLALSRPTGEPGDALADLASAVREANASEIEQLMTLRHE